MYYLVILTFLAVVSASPRTIAPRNQRIIGGDITTIEKYPSAAPLLKYDCFNNIYTSWCAGSIINARNVLTAAHCVWEYLPIYYRKVRLGSTYANSGGVVHDVANVILHPDYHARTVFNDIALVQSKTRFEYTETVARAPIAGRNYHLKDDEAVWAVGWGIYNLTTEEESETLREVEVFTVNWDECQSRYNKSGVPLAEHMLCTGILDVGGKDQCSGDSGSPVYHNNVIVGVCSWGPEECAHPLYPGVNMLVSAFADWIRANALEEVALVTN